MICRIRRALPGHTPLGRIAGSSRGLATAMGVDAARSYCHKLVKEKDRSSFLLNSYIPRSAQDAFIAVRAFNIDTARITDSASRPELAKLKFDFWKKLVQKVFAAGATPDSVPAEPVAVLLASALNPPDGQAPISLSKRYLITLLQTREAYVTNPPFRNLDAMASYGEGTYSQLNYLTQELLYSVSPIASQFVIDNPPVADLVSNIVAHIGQATGISSHLRGFAFFVNKGFVPLPVDLMAQHNLSQDAVLSGDSSIEKQLNDVVFETATRANDHLISASTLMSNLNDTLGGSVPDSLFVPFLASVPVKLFLERLEQANFNVVHPSLAKSEWRLPYRSYKSYKTRRI